MCVKTDQAAHHLEGAREDTNQDAEVGFCSGRTNFACLVVEPRGRTTVIQYMKDVNANRYGRVGIRSGVARSSFWGPIEVTSIDALAAGADSAMLASFVAYRHPGTRVRSSQ